MRKSLRRSRFMSTLTQRVSLALTLIATLLVMIMGGLAYVAFARMEDEMVNALRLAAMKWALIANFTMIVVGTILIYGIAYFQFMSFSLFSLLVIYNLKFRMLYRQHLKQ